MHLAFWLVAFGVAILACASASERVKVPAPLLLVAVGAIGSYLPFVPDVELEPDLVLLGLLPPLLFATSLQASLIDFRSEIRAIGMLSVGLVMFTAAAVGFVAYALLPIPLAAALALGAIVGPPDAVAATAVARRIGLPRRIVTILEGESLLNDATAIVLLRMSIAGILGAVSFGEIALSFGISVVGGVAVGWLISRVAIWIYRHTSDPVQATATSLVVPFVAYIPAEEIHASGVVSVVVAGLLIAHHSHEAQTPAARTTIANTWHTIQFVLENAVFLLIGLQIKPVVEAVAQSPLGWGRIVVACVVVLVTVIVARPVWMGLYRFVPDRFKRRPLSGRATAVASWAGMRGVVTLAAALVLPVQTPHREVLIFAAFVVTAGTLLIQGLTLPWVARRLNVRGPGPMEDALQQAHIVEAASSAGLSALDDALGSGSLVLPPEIAEELRAKSRERTYRVWEQLGANDETPNEQYRRARLLMLAAERAEVLKIRNTGGADHEILQGALRGLDVEEAILTTLVEREEDLREAKLTTPSRIAGECAHLLAVDVAAAAEDAVDLAPTADHCVDCDREGTNPVALRICLACGNVACCDSSQGMHATRHFEETGHPVMRSFEPGEEWRWCYIDATLG